MEQRNTTRHKGTRILCPPRVWIGRTTGFFTKSAGKTSGHEGEPAFACSSERGMRKRVEAFALEMPRGIYGTGPAASRAQKACVNIMSNLDELPHRSLFHTTGADQMWIMITSASFDSARFREDKTTLSPSLHESPSLGQSNLMAAVANSLCRDERPRKCTWWLLAGRHRSGDLPRR